MTDTNVHEDDQDGQSTTHGNTRAYSGDDADQPAETGSFLATLVNQLILNVDAEGQTAFPKTKTPTPTTILIY